MCGLVGVVAVDRDKGVDALMRLLREASVRGLHATGVAWVEQARVHTEIRAEAAEVFCSNFPTIASSELVACGHCRYSTSGEAHQPISNGRYAVAHNGVASQEPHSSWASLYGVEATTDNDSELLLLAREAGQHPLVRWPEASIAGVDVAQDGTLRAYRNGKRPLCFAHSKGLFLVASTPDILARAGFASMPPQKISAGQEVTARLVNGEVLVTSEQVAACVDWCP